MYSSDRNHSLASFDFTEITLVGYCRRPNAQAFPLYQRLTRGYDTPNGWRRETNAPRRTVRVSVLFCFSSSRVTVLKRVKSMPHVD